jgi:diaminohydroxyphosphoribosylaminopyrimidine deaminase/5-amino-6-(5-phosphoribosylamino)uracil reductase
VSVDSLDASDRAYLARARELAELGRGTAAPNPCVGALIVRGGTVLGEGFHRRRGLPHAEVEALAAAAAAGHDVRGATMVVSLEPCDHTGLTPPCSVAVANAGIARVVVGTTDPDPRTAGRGVARLRAAGVEVRVVDDAESAETIADFSGWIARETPFLRIKMAASLDGKIAPAPGSFWLTGGAARGYVHDLRASHDAVLVGAGTVRVDDPLLTVRPPRPRARPYVRVVACEDAPVSLDRAMFRPEAGYARSIVLAPAGMRERFEGLDTVADVVYAGAPDATRLELRAALVALHQRGIGSVLCEGGPTLAARLLARGLADRLDWLVAPTLLSNPAAVSALAGANVAGAGLRLRFDRFERLGPDLLISARVEGTTGV